MTGGQSVGRSEGGSRLSERVAQACAAVTVGIALLALAGWVTGHLILARLHPDFIPMSPATILAFLLLGGTLLAGNRASVHPRFLWLACAAATLVLLMGLLILGQHLTGTDLGFERWLSRTSVAFGQVPIGRMSPLGAGTFVVASLAMLILLASPAGWRLAHELAVNSAAGVAGIGVLMVLGYWRGITFLRGGGLIPMPLPAAAAFVFLGAGLLAAARPRFRTRTLRGLRPVVIGFGVGLAVSIVLFAFMNWQEQERIQAEFERKADMVTFAFRNALKDNLENLENIRALYAVSRTVDRDAFRTFASQILARHPGIQAFSWSPRVMQAQRAAYETAARRGGFPAYQFTERLPNGRLGPAQRRPEYVPVFYQEPYTGNEAALGFDNLSNPARRATLEKARDTGQPVATEPITLVQQTGRGVGILIYQPVYRTGRPIATLAQRRAHLLGFAVEVLRLDHLLRMSLPNLDGEGLEYRLVDATATIHEDLITASEGAAGTTRTGLVFSRWLTVADRHWRLEMYPAPWYLAVRQSGQAWVVLGSGLFLTILLGTYLLASARHTTDMTLLAESLRKISRAVEYSPAAVVITDTQGAIEYVNPKFIQVAGYSLEEAIGQNPRILKSGEMSPEAYQQLWTTITAGNEWRGEFHNKKKSGELFWEAASISPVRGPDGRITHFVAVKEDITERKRIETAERGHLRQLEAVRALGMEIIRELDLGVLLRLITERVVELMGTGLGTIRLWDEAEQVLIPKAWTGIDPERGTRRLHLGEGVVGIAAERRQGMIVNNYRVSPYATPALLQGTTHTAVLAEPLVFGDRLVGVISIAREADQEPLTEEDRQLLALFASQAAIAIENARLHEAAVCRSERLEALLRSLQTVMSGLDLRAILDRILDEAIRITGAPHVKVLLLDKATQTLQVGALKGSAMPPASSMPMGVSLSGWVAQEGKRLFLEDAQSDPRNVWAERDRELGIVTYLGLPIKSGDEVLGVLSFNTISPRQYTPEEMTLLTSFADQAAIAIENARLYDAAQRELAERRLAEAALAARTRQLEIVRKVSVEITHELDLVALLDLIVGRAVELMGGSNGMIRLWDADSQWLVPRGWVGNDPHNRIRRLRLGQGVAGTAAQRRQGMIVNDFRTSPYAMALLTEGSTHTGVLAEPLLLSDRLVGVISIEHEAHQRPFTEEDRELLALFAAQAAIAIENARLHAEVTQHATTLEARVRERTTELAVLNVDLTAALRQAEAGNQAKSDFLLNMSHELRTPLNSILGFAQILQEQAKDRFDDKQRRYLDNIYKSGQHLLALINGILDLEKVEAGRLALELTQVNVAEVIADALAATQESAHRKGQAVRAAIPPDLPALTAEPVRIKQILFNLLSNAVKFTPAGGSVRVTARRICDLQLPICDLPSPEARISDLQLPISDLQNGNAGTQSQIANQKSQMRDFVEIAIADTGIGLSAEDLSRLFQTFSQLEAPIVKSHGGVGLGLALAKRLVELHGGRIWAESPGVGQGSTFTVRLPLGGPGAEA